MKRGLKVVSPDHPAAYEGLVNLPEERAGDGRFDVAVKHYGFVLLCESYVCILQQAVEDFECAEMDGSKLKGLCGEGREGGGIVRALRNWFAQH